MRKLLVALVSLSVVIVLGVLFFAPPFSVAFSRASSVWFFGSASSHS